MSKCSVWKQHTHHHCLCPLCADGSDADLEPHRRNTDPGYYNHGYIDDGAGEEYAHDGYDGNDQYYEDDDDDDFQRDRIIPRGVGGGRGNGGAGARRSSDGLGAGARELGRVRVAKPAAHKPKKQKTSTRRVHPGVLRMGGVGC